MSAFNGVGAPGKDITEAEKAMSTLAPFRTALRESDLSSRTVREYVSRVRQYIEWSEGRLDAETLRKYRDYLHEGGQVKPQTIRQKFVAISLWARYLKQTTGREIPDFAAIKIPRSLPRKRRVPSQQEMDRIWDAAERMPTATFNDQFLRARTLAVLSLLADCGLRRNEVLKLRVSDLQLRSEDPEILIRNSKGGQSRMVPVSDRTMALIQDWLDIRSGWLELREATDEVKAALFPVDGRRAMAGKCFSNLWKDLLQMAGLAGLDIQPHGVRHRFGSDICAIAGLAVAQKALGHANIMTTATYLHGDAAQLRAAVQALAQRGKGNAEGADPGNGTPQAGWQTPRNSSKPNAAPSDYTPRSQRSSRFRRGRW